MKLNAESNASSTTTFVAFDGPLLVTLIVNFTKSPTVTLVALTVFVMLSFTTGLTVTLVAFVVFEPPSVELTTATLPNVPFARVLATIQNLIDVPAVRLPIVQVTTCLPFTVDFTPIYVPFDPDETYSNAGFNASVTLTFVAFEGPRLVTVIV